MKGKVPQTAPLPGSEEKPTGAPPDAPSSETEPEAPVVAAPPAAAAPDPEASPAAAEPEKPAAPEDPRAAIYERAKARRDSEVEESAKDPQVGVLDTLAGQQPGQPEKPDGEEPDADAIPTRDADAKAGGDPASPPAEGDGVRISVYGQEVVVSEDEVRQAGIATLQKERAAEYRLQTAAQTEARLRQYHRELDEYREKLLKMEKNMRAGKSPGAQDAATATALPTSGATVTVDDAKLAESARNAAQAIYRGDPDETAKALKALLADVAQGRTATPPPVDVKAVAEVAADVVVKRQEQRTEEERRVAVNQTFAREFESVMKHPEAFALAKTKFDALLEADDGRDWVELAREAGNTALYRYPELRPAAEPSNANRGGKPRETTTPERLEQRKTLKARTVVPPSATSVRAAPPAPQQPRSNKTYIADMRAARGLPPAG